MDEDIDGVGGKMKYYGVIYKITNLVNGKVYIGQTIEFKKRMNKHFCRNKSILFRAIQKYGKENFNKEILFYCFNQEELDKKETFSIKQFNSLIPYGYNLTTGGEHPSFSDEVKLKISNAGIGRIVSQETKNKLSKSLKGKKWSPNHFYRLNPRIFSDEHCTKIALARKKQITSPATRIKMSLIRKGMKFSDSHKEKIRLALLGKKFSSERCANISLGCKLSWAKRNAN